MTEAVAPIKFFVAGILSSTEYQKCKFYCQRLHRCLPKRFLEPILRPMLDVAWADYLTKVRRKFGRDLWRLEKFTAVFLNDEYLGSDDELVEYVSRDYLLAGVVNYEEMGKDQLRNSIIENFVAGREYAYMTIAIDNCVVGTMLFLLYADLVPLTVEKFLKKLKKKQRGFKNSPIHRIVRGCWIQCGGWDVKHHRLPCENYIVPHDRRGVLSTCHDGKHQDNSRQFSISLAATPWMDCRYVAFGQLVQGEKILQAIEQIPTYYEFPRRKVEILYCGRFTLSDKVDLRASANLDAYLLSQHPVLKDHMDVRDLRDRESVMMLQRYQTGLYFASTDLQSYLPFLHLPDYLMPTPDDEDEGLSPVVSPLMLDGDFVRIVDFDADVVPSKEEVECNFDFGVSFKNVHSDAHFRYERVAPNLQP